MTFAAIQTGMSTGQVKSEKAMVKGCRLPAGRRMAGATGITKLARMSILSGVAGIAISGCAFENIIDMTVRTSGIHMLPRQFKSG
jgi:hypothetical protein